MANERIGQRQANRANRAQTALVESRPNRASPSSKLTRRSATDHPPGNEPHSRPHRLAVARRLAAFGATLGLAATGLAPAALAADGLELTTPYPAVAVAPGSKVSLDLEVTTTTAQRVRLSLVEVPTGWAATLHGGGFVVDAVETTPGTASKVSLDATVPADATGRTRIVVRAEASGLQTDLVVAFRVEASAAGDVTLTSDFPQLRGAANTTFTFNLNLSNETAEDLTFNVVATGPSDWQVDSRLTSQSQAASAVVKAGSSTGVEITADPPDTVPAGSYDINVQAIAGSRQVGGKLSVEITGSYKLTLTTPDDRLSTHGSAGSAIRQTLVLKNDGTAPLENLVLSSTQPSGWKVTFEPTTIQPIPPAPGAPGQVIAVITPSGDAIAGDYNVTITASNDQTTTTQTIRVTVETSLLWGLVGIGLIVAVLAGLGWVFRRYGRR